MTIIRLFSGGRRFARFWENLELALHEACQLELARDPGLHEGTLFVRLRDRFTLYPVRIGSMRDVTITPVYRREDEDDPLPYIVSARVPFTGSKVLLQTQPADGFRLAYRGRVTRTALLLVDRLPDHDARAFAAALQAELTRLRPLLKAFEPTVQQYDERLREQIERKIKTF